MKIKKLQKLFNDHKYVNDREYLERQIEEMFYSFMDEFIERVKTYNEKKIEFTASGVCMDMMIIKSMVVKKFRETIKNIKKTK